MLMWFCVDVTTILDSLHDFEHVNFYDATERDNMLNLYLPLLEQRENSYKWHGRELDFAFNFTANSYKETKKLSKLDGVNSIQTSNTIFDFKG